MSSGDPQRSGRGRARDENAVEAELRRVGEPPDPLHPTPPAEGKWRGILGEVRGMLARRREGRRARRGH